MEIFISKQLQVVAYSFILGLIFGGLYDIIRITHILCGIASYAGENVGMKRGKLPFLLFFLFDAVYLLTVTAAFSVFQYWQMNGEFRLFVLLSVTAGFAVWRATAGRVVMAFSEAIVRLLRLAARWILVKPLCFLSGLLLRMLRYVYRRTIGRGIRSLRRGMRRIRSEHIRKKFGNDICFAAENKRKST